MSSIKKYNPDNVTPNIETRSLRDISLKSGNLYLSLAVISKRANQVSRDIKEELHKKLEEFATTTDNLEEVFENREQIEISRYYEKVPHATLLSYQEFMNEKTYYRVPEKPEE